MGVGAMSARNFAPLLQPGSLIITPGDRSDIIELVLAEDANSGSRNYLAGMVLTDGILPPEPLLQEMRDRSLPIISTALDISNCTTAIGHMTVKTEVGDSDKIGFIQRGRPDDADVITPARAASRP
jgi:phosphate acetyltransferase